MKPLIPIEVEFTVGFKHFDTWVVQRGDRFIAVPSMFDIYRPSWVIEVNGKSFYLHYQQGASNRPGRFRVYNWKKGYAKLAANSEINKLAEILYCF